MILVAGSTGLLGSEICRQLVDQGKLVRSLVRNTSDPEKVKVLKKMGCSLVEGDFKDKPSLLKACNGCSTVISTVSSTLSRQEGDNIQTVDHDGNLNLIAAAKESGVKHFIFISFRSQYTLDNPLKKAKQSAEEAIRNSGMKYTILQASIFMEIWLSPALGFNYPQQSVQIPGDGSSPISYISYKDVASFTVACVDNPIVENKVLEIGGPEQLTPTQVIRIFESVSDLPFNVSNIPVAALEQQLNLDPDPLQKAFAGLMIFYANGDAIDMDPILKIIPMELITVEDYANAVMKKKNAVTE